MNYTTQNYKGIPLKLIKRNYEGYKAKRYVIDCGPRTQNVWIPNVFLQDDGTIKLHANLDFIFNSTQGKHKLRLSELEV